MTPDAGDTTAGGTEARAGAAPRSGGADRGPMLAGLAIGAVMLLVALAVALSGRGSPGDGSAVTLTGGGEHTVNVTLVDVDIVPAEITVDPGTRLILDVTNDDRMRHDLAFPGGPATRMLDPGDSQRLDLGTVTAGRTGWCTVPGHRQAGMTLTIRVTGSQAAPDHHADHAGGADQAGRANQAADGRAATIDPDARPGDDFRPYPAALSPAVPAVHRVTLRISDQTRTVAPGVTQRMWTFGGTVPGPTLRGKVGDTFVVTVTNDTDMNHSVDFHASQVSPDRAMREIAPGGRLVFRFTAEHAGAWMYHCATAPMTQHVGNGMYGAVIIDPPGLAPVAAEYVLVQSELYLGPDGQTADAGAIARRAPDAVVFNGYYDQYRYRPLPVPVNGRTRIWVVDAGLDRPTSFHVVGVQFDTAFAEGAYLVRPGNPALGAAQALALQPGQGGFVEFTVAEPGHYPFLTHLMVDAQQGATGVLAATR